MVLGLRSKNRKGTSVQVDYLIHIQEIKPWLPSQYMKSVESVLLQWKNGDKSSGSFTSNVGDGKVEFGKTFMLPVTLYKETSRKSTACDSFQKNYLELSLYDLRKDRASKGQLLGSAGINVADYGIIKDSITISTPINFKKSSKSTAQPVLYANIRPFDRDNSSLSQEVSLDNDGSESFSEVTNEGNDEESEIASFTDDDIDDNFSSHSSRTVSPLLLSLVKNLPGSANNDTRWVHGEPTLPSGVAPSNLEVNSIAEDFKHLNGASSTPSSKILSSNLQNCVNDLGAKVVLPNNYTQVGKNSNHAGLCVSQTNHEADRKGWNDDKNEQEVAKTSNLHDGLMEDKLKKEQEDNARDEEFMVSKNHALEVEQFVGKLPQEAMKRQANLRINTPASNRMSNEVQADTRRDKLKLLKSVQLQFDVAESDEPYNNIEFMKNAKKNDVPENFHKGGLNYKSSEKQKIANNHSDNKVQLKSEVEMLEKELSEAAAKEIGLYPAVARHGKSTKNLQLIERAKEIDVSGDIPKVDSSCALSEREQTDSSFSGFKVELESKVEMLKEELVEAAVLEVGLYSVVAEHGSSANKVHAPVGTFPGSIFVLARQVHWLQGQVQLELSSQD
ncbi:hypothetical protein GH714_017486 [Hevea brasiliensis]|uniref:C2 NT-type domain-containing protein n=1 Tax=Hevea brasiliensis TaxID=3981 RepID=A0A6A6KCL8_HEVBR|nr:hypothetical protein GH714_017486 [Hevea brasiliensis]